ncbi:hypothetical protein AVEN_75205-1 [Araneus ventricosus]|uniref:Uncharacterized protein n=1 Tax=Araneus ventricosus TaxID=182803 RepID=A0A4Y2IR13_ARAVE|nr:hypothetical protein AVEN_75205-1 [Araneus ventricosus]
MDTPPMTPGSSNIPDPVPLYESPMYLLNKRGVNRQESGKKKVKQGKEKMKKQIKNLEKKLKLSEKMNAKLRQRLWRSSKQQSAQESPRTKVSKLLKGTKNVSKTVKKKLLFSELLVSKIKSTYIRSNTAEKRILKSATSGILKKYRCQGYFTSLTSCWKTNLSYGRTERKTKLEKLRGDVKAFLENDMTSRLTAGKKETITRNRQKCQMRLLNDSLKSLHKKFLAAYPCYKDGDLTVSYPLFCKLRPFWILLPKAIYRQTCLCKIHTKMAFLVRSMKISKMIKQSTPQEVIKSICCTNMKEECLERTCQECNKKIVTTLYYDPQTKIKFERWVTKKVKVIIHGNEKISQKTVKVTVECSKQELFKEFLKSMPTFMQHVINVNHQHQIINKIKENLQKKEALLHIDFSENFNCKYAEEIQSTHFGSSKKQLSLHTSVLYCNQQLENKTKPLCFCTVSENLRHDAAAICIHLKPILQELVVQVPQLETLHILSGGPSTQYKNKKIFYLLETFIARETGAPRCVWHFSETGHGKGAPDVVGGTLKRTADNIIAQGYSWTR